MSKSPQERLNSRPPRSGRLFNEAGEVVNLADLLAGILKTKDAFAYASHESNTFTAVHQNGVACPTYGAAPAIAAASIPRITSTVLANIASVDRITMMCTASETNNHLGWFIVLAASQEDAATIVSKALTVGAESNVMEYGIEMTPPASLGNIYKVPPTGEIITADLDMPLSNIFLVPYADATPAVGLSELFINLGVPVA